jgi:outer membrane protein assembly factor BamB
MSRDISHDHMKGAGTPCSQKKLLKHLVLLKQSLPLSVALPAGDIVALRARDGMIHWIYPTPPGSSSLASSDKAIYLGTHLPSRVNRRHPAQVTALHLSTGAVLWCVSPKDLQGPTAVAVDGDQVFAVGSEGNRAVCALDAQKGAIH